MVLTLKNFFIDTISKYISDHDNYSLKLKKISILLVPFIIIPISFLWSAIYFVYGQTLAAYIPLIYTVISFITLLYYRVSDDIIFVQKAQMLLILLLPFILMWSLGGFAQGSYIMIWSFFAPIGALIHDQRKTSVQWLLAFLTLILVSVLIDPWLITHHKVQLPTEVQEIFFFLNISTALGGLYILLQYFIHEKDKENHAKLKKKNMELLKYTKELSKMVYTDALTGLKNRNALIKEKEGKKNLSLILINIDRFSQINDLYGEEIGNRVLIAFSKQLDHSLHKESNCQLFRLSGDEFVILSEEIDPHKVASNISELVKYIDAHPIIIEDNAISLNITVGISFEESASLLSTANMALKIAKRESKSVMFYNKSLSLNEEYQDNMKWIKEIKEAILENRITLFFQPIICNDTGEANKYETLIRLVDRDGNIITPFHFLEIAKKAKLYKELTKIVIQKSFDKFRDNEYDFSINITIDDILDDEIHNYIIDKLKKETRSTTERIIFEIVESENIDNFEEIEKFIKKIKSFGCKIAIDDFGTGYSNFEYLMKLQADFIKIDGSIIKEIVADKKSELITSIIVSFATEMGIQTIGEYVENEEIYNKLRELGVNKSQGYYFDKPKSVL